MSGRPIRRYVRFALFLLREFRWIIAIFFPLMFGAAILFTFTLKLPFAKSCFVVFMLMLAQSTEPFPAQWYDQLLFFVLPIVGLGAVANSVVRLGYLIFTSRRKLQEWWIMEASAYRDHVVLCGLGRVGYRIAQELLALKEPFVVIEKNRESAFAEEILDADVPVLFGEARLRKHLEQANIARAKACILATDDDLANLDTALTAREMNPQIRVVLRLFDDTLAAKVATTFKLPTISASRVSAPAFVAAARGRSVLHAFQLDGRTIHVADVEVDRLAPRTIPQAQKEFDVTIVLHKSAGETDLNPNHDRPLRKGDIIVAVAPMEKILRVEAANRG